MKTPKKNVNYSLSLDAIELLDDVIYVLKKEKTSDQPAVYKSGLIEDMIRQKAKEVLPSNVK